MSKKMLHTKAIVQKENVNLEKGTIDAVVGSTAVIDRMGDIIDQKGWTLKNFKTNPVILWGHNVREERPPIGKALRVWVKGKGTKAAKLMFKIQMDLADSFAVEILRKIKEGFINTVSVGFLPSEWEDLDPDNFWGGRKYTKQDLLELSFVPVPANPEAVVALRSLKDTRFAPVKLAELYPEQKNEPLKTEEVAEEKEEEVIETEAPVIEEIIEDEVTPTEKEEVVDSESKSDKKPKEDEEVKVDQKVGKEEDTEIIEVSDAPKEEEKEIIEVSKIVENEKVVEEEVVEEKEEKGVIRFKDLETLPETEPWDGPGEVAKAETSDLKVICTWFDADKADTKASYKLPHHKAEGHKTVWRGVASAMAKLLGAKGGPEIPEEDRKSVYNHLKKHYKQFEKDVPTFKMVEDQVLAGLTEELQVLSLEREEKHTNRLIKKVLKKQNQQNPSIEQNKKALEVINLALSLYKQDSSRKE